MPWPTALEPRTGDGLKLGKQREKERQRARGGRDYILLQYIYIEVRDMDCAPLSKSKVSFEPFSRVSCFLDGINGRLADLESFGVPSMGHQILALDKYVSSASQQKAHD